jgi:signal peptidase II
VALGSPQTSPPPPTPRPLPSHHRADAWRPGALQWTGLISVSVAAVVADQLTKAVVNHSIALDSSVDVVWPLTLWHVHNQGIAFGIALSRYPVIGLTSCAVLWMVVYFSRSGARHTITPVALGLLLGGSVSNLWDRLQHGYVTDFIYLHWFPTFNFADSFIVTGVGLLLFALYRGDEREPVVDITNR